MNTVYQEIPLTVSHRLFSIEQINHALPLKALSDLPDVTLSVVQEDGTVVHGHFKIIMNLDCKETFSNELLKTTITADLKRQVTDLGYHIPPAPVAEEPAQPWPQTGNMERGFGFHDRKGSRHPIDHSPMRSTIDSHNETPFLYGLESMFRKVFNSTFEFGHNRRNEDLSIRMSGEGSSLRVDLGKDFSIALHSEEGGAISCRDAVASASGMLNNVQMNGRIDHYSEFVNNYTPVFDESDDFQNEITVVILKFAPFLEGTFTDLKVVSLSK